ncbi:MAG: triose-phosphate isomerase, partial [Planctomycetes bacterium]|nr:triose-phosphate isomerase [Planctomycetota bacterium]
TIAEALAFAAELAARAPRARAEGVVCPPFTALAALGPPLRGLAALGAQDVSAHDEGAHTGEVAARHLVELGCRFAIVGHSERRLAGETDALARVKVRTALRGGLDPILCVGETKDERRGGRTQVVVSDQLRAALEGLEPELVPRVVVAYEPRWAIGQGVTPTPLEVADVLAHVRGVIARLAGEAAAAGTSVLYGGSVSEKNAAALLALPGCAGALVGGASLKAATFAAILEAA